MTGDGHAKRASFGSTVKKRFSDITNLHPPSKSPVPDRSKLSSTENCSASVRDYIENLVKENRALANIIADKNKIIELTGNEIHALRVNFQKMQMQNRTLAMTNSLMLAELNLGKDKRKRGGEMGRLFLINLEGKMYSCGHCRTHLALSDDIVSKSFQSRHGKAYLFSKVVNMTVGKKEDRMMMTGLHTVADIFCVGCGAIIGWTYEMAHEKSQKYKEGKSVLERVKISGPEGSSYWTSHEVQVGIGDPYGV